MVALGAVVLKSARVQCVGDAVPGGFGVLIVAVAVRDAALDDFIVQREHEGAAGYIEKELDRFQHLYGFFRQAAVQVINQKEQIEAGTAAPYAGKLAQVGFEVMVDGV